MSLIELLPALRPVVAQFDRLGIAYYIGGSVASSIYGEPRSTLDIDLGVDLPQSIVHELATLWDGEFYVSESAMRTDQGWIVQRGLDSGEAIDGCCLGSMIDTLASIMPNKQFESPP